MRLPFLRLESFALLAASGLLALPAVATEWPSFRGPSYDAAASSTGVFAGITRPALAVDWRRPLGSGYASVSVAGGRAITLFSEGGDEFLIAFDSASGKELWRQKVGPTYKGHDGSHDGAIATPALSRDGVFVLTPQGQLRAFEAADGKSRWSVDLRSDEAAANPYYGYGSSPLILGDHLLVLHPIPEKQAAEAFALATGARVYKTGKDLSDYQSPILATLAGREQVVLAAATRLYGVDGKSGAVLWEIAHEGDPSAMGASSAVPLVIPGDRILLTPRNDTSVLLKVSRGGENFKVEKLWESKAIGRSYSRPVYHQGYFYGYVGGFLTCVKAEDGTAVWRSRPPGDGFLMLLDGHLVVMTKQGTLHLAAASPQGYQELAATELYADHSWTPPSFADGRIYTRSMKEIAAVRIVEAPAALASRQPELPADSAFRKFTESLPQATDPAKTIDAFLATVPSFPLIEGDWVHFLYRGDAQDMGIVGDMLGARVQAPMPRIAGTDLFAYSHRLQPGARVAYRLVRNLDELVTDPRNPRTELGPGPGRNAKAEPWSWVSLPGWTAPSWLDAAPPAAVGKLEKHELPSAANPEVKRPIEVYLPAGYRPEAGPYAVVYVHGAMQALEMGQLPAVFDQLVGKATAPFIAVFVKPPLIAPCC